uniref:Uncharacterized protein n=1 Tax=Setaria viridis TaxID=4556 RepID=A0A4U6U0A9_SETVI|nr:hypothetical protein SEVIR_6G051800v2 [Setaria viridis]
MPIPRPIRSVAGEGSSRPRALPPIHLPSPSAAGRFEPVLRRFEPVRADSSYSTGPPSQGRQAGGPAGPLRSSLTQAHGWISHGSGKDWSGSSLLRHSYRVAFHWRQW